MAAEFTSIAEQTVNPGETIIFTDVTSPCRQGLIQHVDNTGNFVLKGSPYQRGGCRCCQSQTVNYLVAFGANIAIPEGETVGAISVALTVDGSTVPASTMIVTPAAVAQYQNVSREILVPILKGCCQAVAVRNTSAIPILVIDANILFSRPDLNVTRW